MPFSPKKLGKVGEEWAAHYLRSKGYEIIDHQVHSRFGEIDLITQDGDTIVFVEVKTRSNRNFGSPEEALTTWKQYKLIHAAEDYLSRIDHYREDWRVDLVVIEVDKGGLNRIDHYENVLW